MAKLDKKTALQIIVKSAKDYELRLNNKHFLIIYQECGYTKMVSVGFRDMNFLHMTGVTTKLSAQQFYDACLNGKLSESNFEIDKQGKVQQKLDVLPYLSDLLYHDCMIGNFINSGICIRADYFVGNTKAVLSVGFRMGKEVDYPVTLYKEDVRKLSSPSNRVLAILVKDYKQSKYNSCVHLSKGQHLNKLLNLNDIKAVVDMGH